MEPVLNRYDVDYACVAHPRVSREQYEAIYSEARFMCYSPEHIKTLLCGAVATGVRSTAWSTR
jgi:hypothetical protein